MCECIDLQSSYAHIITTRSSNIYAQKQLS